MSAKETDFLQAHSLRFLEMAFRTDRRETVVSPDGFGERTGDCGDTVRLFLSVRDERIANVSYDTDGCLNTNACANTLAVLAEGRRVDDAWQISPESVAEYLETLPEDHFHCAELVVGALYRALQDYHNKHAAASRRSA